MVKQSKFCIYHYTQSISRPRDQRGHHLYHWHFRDELAESDRKCWDCNVALVVAAAYDHSKCVKTHKSSVSPFMFMPNGFCACVQNVLHSSCPFHSQRHGKRSNDRVRYRAECRSTRTSYFMRWIIRRSNDGKKWFVKSDSLGTHTPSGHMLACLYLIPSFLLLSFLLLLEMVPHGRCLWSWVGGYWSRWWHGCEQKTNTRKWYISGSPFPTFLLVVLKAPRKHKMEPLAFKFLYCFVSYTTEN